MELVPLRKEFAPAMLAGGPNNDEVNRFTGTHATFSLADCEAYIERTLNDPNRYTRAITEDGRYLGEVVLTINDDNRSAGFRIALWDGFGKGYGTAAIRHVLDHAFDERTSTGSTWRCTTSTTGDPRVPQAAASARRADCATRCSGTASCHDAIVMSILSTDNI